MNSNIINRIFCFVNMVFIFNSKITTKIAKNLLSNEMKKYVPKTPNQENYINKLNDQNIKLLFGIGPAGTGKTLFACHTAVDMLKNGVYNKIIITRPLISVDEENVGFLPGNLVNKMQPWMQPIIDIFAEYYSKQCVNSMISNGVIEISPLAYMRGRTFKDAFIIADEMQNSSPNQMLMMTTRVGLNSRLVITGDLKQTDRTGINGLQDFINKYKKYNSSQIDQMKEIDIVELNENDIERSPLVSKIMDIYNFVPIDNLADKSMETSFYISDKKNNDDGNSDSALIPKSHFHSKNSNI